MRRLFLLCLLCLGFLSGVPAEESPRRFHGWLYFEESDESPWTMVIDNQKALDEVRNRIPKIRPTKKQPAPPNNDPLLTEVVDFEKFVIVIVARNQTISAYPEFHALGDGEVSFSLPEPPAEARPYGWGTYRAVILPAGEYRIDIVQD